MYSKIENGVLTKFDECDLVNGHYDIPNSVTSIGFMLFLTVKI